MSIETRIPRCQFLFPTENSNVGRVKISQQHLAVFATQRVSRQQHTSHVWVFSRHYFLTIIFS